MYLINECKQDLLNLYKAKSAKERNKILKKVKNCVVTAISEISLNCLKGNVPLTKCKYNQLQKYKKVLRSLSRKSIPIASKRKLISQKGGFLNILIPAVLSLLASSVGEIIKNRRK